MFDLRSRAGIAGVATGATLLALPVVATGQVPVVDQVVGGVTQTAQSLTAAPVPQAELPAPAGKPAPLPPRAGPAPVPAASVPAAPPAPAPREAPSTSAPNIPAGGDAARSSKRRSPGAREAGGQQGSASASGSSGERASAAQADTGADSSASGEADGATDVEIAAADSGDAGGPASLPFTGLQLGLLGIVGMAALAGGALLRRAARAA
jgi:hypothetical protein